MNPESASGDDPRGARIRRAWHAAWGDPQRLKVLEAITFCDAAQLVGPMNLVLAMSLHFEVLAPDADLLTIPGAIVAALALFLPVQSWATVSYLEARRQKDDPVPRRWKVLAFLAGCVPLFNLYLWPLWRRFASDGPSLAGASPAGVLHESGLGWSWRPSVSRVPLHLGGLSAVGTVVSVFLLPLAWSLWITEGETLAPSRRANLLLLCAGFQLVAAISFPFGLRAARRRVDSHSCEGVLLRWLPLIVLLGLPGVLIGLVTCVKSNRVVASGLLTSAVFERSTDWRRKGVWTGLDTVFRQREAQTAGRRRPWLRLLLTAAEPKAGRADRRRSLFFHFKSMLLCGSTAVLSWWAFDRWGSQGFWLALYVMGAMAGLGLLLELLLLYANILGENALSRLLLRQPYGFFLFASQSMALFGLLAGAALAEEQALEVGKQLFLLGPTLASLLGLVALIRRGFQVEISGAVDVLLSLAATFVFLGVAIFMSSVQDHDSCRPWILAFVIAVEITLGLGLGGWLLRPFRWRQILEPALPLRVRLTLLLIATSAVLPAGGMAIPLWILARQRWWRRWEDLRWRSIVKVPC